MSSYRSRPSLGAGHAPNIGAGHVPKSSAVLSPNISAVLWTTRDVTVAGRAGHGLSQ